MPDLRLLIIIVDPITQTESKPEEVHYYIHTYIYTGTIISCGVLGGGGGGGVYRRRKRREGQGKPIGAHAESVYNMVGRRTYAAAAVAAAATRQVRGELIY